MLLPSATQLHRRLNPPDEPPIVQPPSQSSPSDTVGETAAARTTTNRVAAARAPLTLVNARGQDPGIGGRTVILDQSADMELLTPPSAHRVKVRLENGRVDYVFSKDIEPVPVSAPVVSAPFSTKAQRNRPSP